MSKPIEQALDTIIPRRSGPLPPELIELANSLLAQSRNKCTVKGEEEIARVYTCANLACERLKTTLNLPQIEIHPPLPPRVYSKLYTYFDRTLKGFTARSKSRAGAASASNTPNSKAGTPKRPPPPRQSPSKEESFAGFRTTRTPKSGLKWGSNKENEEKVPKWVNPVIRLLCKDLDTPRAAPHIITGVESILVLPSSPVFQTKMEGKIPALVASIWFFVVVKMRGKLQQGKENMERKRLVRESLARARNDADVLKKVGKDDEHWKGWSTVEERDVNAWRKEIVDNSWREMDWFENVEEGCGVNYDDFVEKIDNMAIENPDEDADDIRSLDKKKSSARKPTTVLDKYDYLSEAKQRQYQLWRDEMLAKVNELMAEAMPDDNSDVEMS